MAGSPVGLQQLLRAQGLEWGDSNGHDSHLWYEGDRLYIDAKFTLVGFGTMTATGTAPSPAPTGVSSGTFWNVTAPDGGDGTVGAGGSGGAITLTTGDGGSNASGNSSGGDFTIFMGSGSNPNVAGSVGHQGNFKIRTQDVGSGLGTFPITMNGYGIGVGTNTGAIYGVPFQANWTMTDATSDVAGLSAYFTYVHTENQSHVYNALTSYIVTDVNAFDHTGTIQTFNNELLVRQTGGTLSRLVGASSEILPIITSAATMSDVICHYAIIANNGTGTVTLGRGFTSTMAIGVTGGAADSNVGTFYGYTTLLQNQATAATGGIVTLWRGYNVEAPTYGTGTQTQATTITGFYVNTLANTRSASSTSGGFQTAGLYVNLGNQGGNTSGTDTNLGIYIVGNGGTAGGGGTVNNWAIKSDSTAPSQFLGLITTKASVTGGAGLNLPHGTAPTSPVNGDVWTTTAGLFVRVNGSTVGPLS